MSEQSQNTSLVQRISVLALLFSVLASIASGYALYLGTSSNGSVFLSADFEQAYYDARSANLKIDAGKWIQNKAEALCKKERCVIFQGKNVLGGNVIDLNKEFRKQFSISVPAKKPAKNTDELLKIIQGISPKHPTDKK